MTTFGTNDFKFSISGQSGNTTVQLFVPYTVGIDIKYHNYTYFLRNTGNGFSCEFKEALTDLLGYVGTAIRLNDGVGQGIRFKSSIKQSVRDGNEYDVTEYGTLAKRSNNTESLVYSATSNPDLKIGKGVAYNKADGKNNEFDRVDGDVHFTSVLINISAKNYALDYIFRSYCSIKVGEETFYVYGLTVDRNIVDIAERVKSDMNYFNNELNANQRKYIDGVINTVYWERTIPVNTAGVSGGVYNSGDGTKMYYYTQAGQNGYLSYLQTLEQNEFVKHSENQYGSNKYATYTNDFAVVHTYYTADKNTMRVIVSEQRPLPATVAEPYTSTQATSQLCFLETDNDGYDHNGGLSIAVILRDGSFIIVDGGFPTQKEVDDLYQFLRSNTPAGQKPVISGWFFTHPHVDHVECFIEFMPKYGDDVIVEALYYNFTEPTTPIGDWDVGTRLVRYSRMDNAIAEYCKDTVVYKVNTGMRFPIRNAEIEILYTHEDLYPTSLAYGNDMSIVFRITAEGQSLIILGDLQTDGSNVITSTLKNYIESELVQYSHHGYTGGTIALYNAIDPKVILWPTRLSAFHVSKNNTSYPANRYVMNKASIEKIIVSGSGTIQLPLPYTPSGLRAPLP